MLNCSVVGCLAFSSAGSTRFNIFIFTVERVFVFVRSHAEFILSHVISI